MLRGEVHVLLCVYVIVCVRDSELFVAVHVA